MEKELEQPLEEEPEEVTLKSLADRIDIIGQQMDWLCENLQSLFAFVNQMSGSGGGIMGMMKALKNGAPDMSPQPEKVG